MGDSLRILIEKTQLGAGEMAQELEVLSALLEGQSADRSLTNAMALAGVGVKDTISKCEWIDKTHGSVHSSFSGDIFQINTKITHLR